MVNKHLSIYKSITAVCYPLDAIFISALIDNPNCFFFIFTHPLPQKSWFASYKHLLHQPIDSYHRATHTFDDILIEISIAITY